VTAGRARILIVEDDGLIALELEDHLRELGYEVTGVVADGAGAVAHAAASAPDLVLMDLSLRGPMDGLEAARRILAGRDVPIVFVSAYGDDTTRARARDVSASGFLAKPYNSDQLRTTLDAALR
jgi:CheY-like chemotaxis protein